MKILLFTVCCILLAAIQPVKAASSVLVWPIYQVIDADQKGSALWLENRGATPVRLQVRILDWKQQNQQESYAEQGTVVASPPFATIEAGKRQLIRLIRINPVAPGTERAFRILIDELPAAATTANSAFTGLKLQVRYVLPLFLNGEGIWSRERSDKGIDTSRLSGPELSWSITLIKGKPFLTVANRGRIHARLSNVFWGRSNNPDTALLNLSRGFLGYVLPGQSMRWPLPEGKSAPGREGMLYAQLADNQPAVQIRHAQ
ncbi:molecular chaperone [uncultured Pluralibacter sp.]|uniref:fimbrial biogenesis chaperone n=1 Tax=uncultured Pluralibacter sp. TaxID=1490864 RepID=UPI002627BCEC|nr:molecular chaperone [uncultured Pluralibacter sp.]